MSALCRGVTLGNNPIEIDGASNNSVDDIEAPRDRRLCAEQRCLPHRRVHMLSKAAFRVAEDVGAHSACDLPVRDHGTRQDHRHHPVARAATSSGSLRPSRSGWATSPNRGPASELLRARGVVRADARRTVICSTRPVSRWPREIVTRKCLRHSALSTVVLHRMVEGLCTGDAAACLDVVEQVYGRLRAHAVHEELLEMLRHATFLRTPEVRRHVDLSDDEVAHLTELLHVSPDVLTQQFTALLDVHEQIARAQRPRIVLDMAIARLTDIRPAAPVVQLIERLEALEGKSVRIGRWRPGRRSSTWLAAAPRLGEAPAPPGISTSTKPPPMSAKAPPKPAPAPPRRRQPRATRPPQTPWKRACRPEKTDRPVHNKVSASAPSSSSTSAGPARRGATERAKDPDRAARRTSAALAQQQLDNTHLLELVATHLNPAPLVLRAIRGTEDERRDQQMDADDLCEIPQFGVSSPRFRPRFSRSKIPESNEQATHDRRPHPRSHRAAQRLQGSAKRTATRFVYWLSET